MSASKPLPTNIPLSEVEMDGSEERDSRYYCLPPFRGDPRMLQGHVVGIFDSWAAAKISLTGYKGSGNKGFDTIEECVQAWQAMCPLGVHPHPVDPAHANAEVSASVPTPPSSSSTFVLSSSPPTPPLPAPTFVFSRSPPAMPRLPRRGGAASPARTPERAQPANGAPPPTSQSRSPAPVSFAIRGEGIVSSSPWQSQQRYEALQRRGQEPEMLVTHSFARASLFALEQGVCDEGGASSGAEE